MNIERLQKINMLASELRKHNISTGTEEAYQEAEQVYEGNQTQIFRPPTAEHSDSPVRGIRQEPPPGLQQRQTEIIIQMHLRKYDEKFEQMRATITNLEMEIGSLRANISKLQSMQPREVQMPLQQPTAPQKPQVKEEKQEKHPRQGDFSPADVDIQKMFYFGSKR